MKSNSSQVGTKNLVNTYLSVVQLKFRRLASPVHSHIPRFKRRATYYNHHALREADSIATNRPRPWQFSIHFFQYNHLLSFLENSGLTVQYKSVESRTALRGCHVMTTDQSQASILLYSQIFDLVHYIGPDVHEAGIRCADSKPPNSVIYRSVSPFSLQFSGTD